MEPTYTDESGRFNAMAAAWLFSKDYVFFNSEDIAWEGGSHCLRGIQINKDCLAEICEFMRDPQCHVNGIAALLASLEKDEALRVPRESVHPSLYGMMGEGDLTGITVFNLLSGGSYFGIQEDASGGFIVRHDVRLSRGIPGFYELIARMVADMRLFDGLDTPFSITYLVVTKPRGNDDVLGPVDGCVEGALSRQFFRMAFDWGECAGDDGERAGVGPRGKESAAEPPVATAQELAEYYDAAFDESSVKPVAEGELSVDRTGTEKTTVLDAAAIREELQAMDAAAFQNAVAEDVPEAVPMTARDNAAAGWDGRNEEPPAARAEVPGAVRASASAANAVRTVDMRPIELRPIQLEPINMYCAGTAGTNSAGQVAAARDTRPLPVVPVLDETQRNLVKRLERARDDRRLAELEVQKFSVYVRDYEEARERKDQLGAHLEDLGALSLAQKKHTRKAIADAESIMVQLEDKVRTAKKRDRYLELCERQVKEAVSACLQAGVPAEYIGE